MPTLPWRMGVLGGALLIALSTLGCRGGSSTEPKSATGTAVSAATIAPRPSPGCDAPAPVPGVQIEHLTSNAVDRIYRRFIPPTDVTGPMPLVLNLHGLLSNIDQQVAISGFETMAAPERFIVVTPQGVGTPPGWSFDGTANNPDLTFLNAVLDEVEANACVDTARIYATGLSNGGMMSSLLACYDADRIAAVGLVSGILHPGGCQPSRPMPMLVLWGKQDGILPYCGGVGPSIGALLSGKPIPDDVTPMCPPASFSGLPPVEEVVASWAKTDGCDATPLVAAVSDHVEQRTFSGCDGAALQFYTVADGGHTWPGSKFMQAISGTAAGAKLIGITTNELDASTVIWRFFQQHALAP